MKLGINMVPLFPGKIGGAEQYIRNILKGLMADKSLDVFLFLNIDAIDTFKEEGNIKKYVIDLEVNQIPQFNYYIDMLNIDVWFCPFFHLIPEECPVPSVVSIFDIQQEYFPQNFSKAELFQRRIFTKKTLNAADKIITISEFSKNTIIDKYNIPDNKIAVTYLDADGCFYDTIAPQKLQLYRKQMGYDYIFYPANSWPHKNHLKLLEAYLILKQEYKVSLKLVFTGNPVQKQSAIEKYIDNHNLFNDVLYLGYVDQADMPYIYAGATVMAFPSLFEGFGIPLVEAMCAGVPIACSQCGSVPEIAGDAAEYFDAENPRDIAEKLYKLISAPKRCEELISIGRKRAELFSWDKCVTETIREIKSVFKDVKPTRINEEFPLVSIVTPSYNQGMFIRETIESVLTQDYPNIEYIVMDGGSTDETVSILQSYGDRIKWVSEKDDGQADAVNKGIVAAKGQVIGWINSDDTYMPGAISTIVNYFKQHPQIDMVYGEGFYIDKESNTTGRYSTEKFDKSRLAEVCIICQPTAFFYKEFVEKVGLLDKDLQLCMDYELWMKMAKEGRISYIDQYLATSRMYEENKTLSQRGAVHKEVCTTVKKHYGYVPISWIYGYAHHVRTQKSGFFFFLTCGLYFVYYNFNNLPYSFMFTLRFLKRKFVKRKPLEYLNITSQYPDGWLSKEYRTFINAQHRFSNIEISGKNCFPNEEALEICIEIDKEQVGRVLLEEHGDFTLRLELTQPLEAGPHMTTFYMDKTFQPPNDPRHLSFILESISLE